MEELVKKAQNGDEEAFTNLMLLFKNDLYKLAKSRLYDDDDVWETIQETMITAFKSIKNLKKASSFKIWIIKILINKSNSIYSKNKQRNVITLEEVVDKDYSGLENVETKLDFNFICKNLKYEDRIIIILYYMERFTDKEISQILNLKENTVKTKRTRALQQIKNTINKGDRLYG